MDDQKTQYKKIFSIFIPLALSWIIMSVDNPSVSAIISRLRDPEISLAAHGGIVYPVSVFIEAPIMPLISTSLALSKDWLNYQKIYRFMMIQCFVLTIVHALVSFTPLYYVVVRDIIGAPEALLPYARIGLFFMLPWTWAIGYRRFYQGVLIRCGFSRMVTVGSIVRMFFMVSVLLGGYMLRDHLTGTVVAALGLTTGVVAEAVFTGIKGRSVAKRYLDHDPDAEVISWRDLMIFSFPLIITQMFNFGWMFMGSAAMSRMINPIASLAVWPVLSGLLNLFRSFGSTCNEVSLTLLSQSGFYKTVRKFTIYVGIGSTIIYLVFMLTPIKDFWFLRFSGLSEELAALAEHSLSLLFLMPFFNAILNFNHAIMLHKKKTNGILRALLVYFMIIGLFMAVGIYAQRWQGILVIATGMNVALVIQTFIAILQTRKFVPDFVNETAILTELQ